MQKQVDKNMQFPKRTPFIVFQRKPRKIMTEVHKIFKSNEDASKLTYAIAKFLLALRNVDIIDDYKVSVNFMSKKLHVSYKWVNSGHLDATFNLEKKIIMVSAMNPSIKE